ncbi:phosphate ABC transporter ATP-binding protein PstB [symbiont of Argiope bruennichi]|uniref:phosphate ABC transporter ATP-binding protein PstB n=1 Tax=symbiont of Argiope bruennichi TaxID=2810479 RepID=UPI003DA555F1
MKEIKDPIIEVKNFSLRYKEKRILKNIDLVFKKNVVTSIIGPSGCGKSTLLKCLNRLIDFEDHCFHKGDIIFEDKSIFLTKDCSNLRYKIGTIFQRPTVFPFSIFENVIYGLKIHGIKDKKFLEKTCIESLKLVSLYDEVKEILQNKANLLSGGQQQRLCIARAIALNPEIILMDEPTSALDPISTAKIEHLILELKKSYTIILVTHSLQQAMKISDYTVFIKNGRIIEYNDTKTLFSKPKNKLTENYITGRFE